MRFDENYTWKNMIPKIIHYCWFGGNPLPPLALECIASWRKYLPDYEVWEWSESSTPALPNRVKELMPDKVMAFDVNIITYTEEAYKQKKYAFVSDYARFWIMYKYGGIYFDTDVEVIRPMDDIVAKGNFMGCETDGSDYDFITVNPGLGLGFCSGDRLLEQMLCYYSDLRFDMLNGKIKTIVGHTTDVLIERGLRNVAGIQVIDDITIYPSEYFCPINITTKRLHVTEKTRSIHRYMDSWNGNKKSNCKDKIRTYLPEWSLLVINRLKRIL